MKKNYEKPLIISGAEVEKIRKQVDDIKRLRRSMKRDGYSDEEIEALLAKGVATQLDPETYEYDRFNIMKPGTTYNMIMGGMSM